MHVLALLMATLLAGGPSPGSVAQERRLVVDERAGRRLELVRTARAETTPPVEGTLEVVDRGVHTRVAEGIRAAVFAPDGAILALRRGALVRLSEGREQTLLEGRFAPELAIDPAGSRLALVRRLPRGGSAIDVLELTGDPRPREVVAARGFNNAPAFSPDGRTLLFVSTRTGLSSVFRVGVDGQGERQLTNRGLAAVGPGFVAPPEERSATRFEGERFSWTASGARWFVDLATGASGRAPGGGER